MRRICVIGRHSTLTEMFSLHAISFALDIIRSLSISCVLTQGSPLFSAQQVRELFKPVKHLVSVGRSAKDK